MSIIKILRVVVLVLCLSSVFGCATPHLNAANGNYKEVREYIGRPGADLNAVDGFGDSMLMKAIWRKQYQIVDLLLKYNANTNIESKNGSTALSLALANGDFDLAERLVQKGANPNHVNKNNVNLVFSALALKNISALDFISKHRVNLDQKDNSGNTALGLALFASNPANRDLVFAKRMVELGAGIDVQSSLGRTPLFLSIDGGYFDFAEYLIGKNANPSIAADNRLTPLQLAIHRRNARLAELMIKPSTVNQRDGKNNTPLILAADASDVGLAKALIKGGAAVNTINDFGSTALSYAAKHGNSEMVYALLAAGANPTLGSSGQDPLTVARAHNRIEVVAILENAIDMRSGPKSKVPPTEKPPGKSRGYDLALDSTGSAVRVSEKGVFATNSHVVNGCTEIKIGGVSVQLVAEDKVNDLAIVKGSSGPAAHIRMATDVKIGESVVVVGFPLSGLLGSGIQANSGDISALSGIGNDSRGRVPNFV